MKVLAAHNLLGDIEHLVVLPTDAPPAAVGIAHGHLVTALPAAPSDRGGSCPAKTRESSVSPGVWLFTFVHLATASALPCPCPMMGTPAQVRAARPGHRGRIRACEQGL
jgi:hypothetical protein